MVVAVAEDPVAIPKKLPNPLPPTTRTERFPSREQRLKLYLSNWYIPPCANYSDGHVHYKYMDKEIVRFEERRDRNASLILNVESTIVPDKLFYVEAANIQTCASYDEESDSAVDIPAKLNPRNMRMYCVDVRDDAIPADEVVAWEKQNQKMAPLLFQFGDLKHSHDYGFVHLPHFKKFRSASLNPAALQASTAATGSKSCLNQRRNALHSKHSDTIFQPMIWKLATNRHFRLVHKVYREDTPWKKKKNVAAFRGQLTGAEHYNKEMDHVANCYRLIRCRLVYETAHKPLIDARLTSTRERFPEVLKGRKLLGGKISMRKLLEYKALIMIEGNDVASGLKWALLSQSVVLMPIPAHTSWAMEELLEPWVHFVPLEANLTDVETKMQWVVDHDAEARAISQRATLWMEDLVFHPDAREDDVWIQREMMRRYQAHFTRIK